MGANLDAMLFGQAHGLAHVIEVGAMESASDVGDVDLRHQAFVVAHLVEAKGFAHVAINRDHLCVSFSHLPHSIAAFSKPTPNPPERDACRVQQASSSW